MTRKSKNPFEYSYEYYIANPSDYIDKLKTWIVSNPKGWYANFKKTNLEMIDFINSKYPQLNGRPFPEKLYWFINNLTEFPLCQTCHENPTRFVSVKDGYANWCCNKCAQMDEQVKKKIVQSKIKKFGKANNSQTDEFKKKIRELIRNRTPEQKREIRNKFIETSNRFYGCDHPTKNESVKQKIRLTQIERKDEIQSKSRDGCFRKHGCYYTGQIKCKIEKTNQTFKIKYGGHPFKMELNGKRLIENLKSISFADQRSKRYILVEDCNNLFTVYRKGDLIPNNHILTIQFDSMWEIYVYVYCRKTGIPVEYHPNIKFRYLYDGKFHWYEPDFRINGSLYEVKGDNFFRLNRETGKEEMYCTWRNHNWTDEKYEYECRRIEAKHKCMLQNGVTIIRWNEIKNLDKLFTSCNDCGII